VNDSVLWEDREFFSPGARPAVRMNKFPSGSKQSEFDEKTLGLLDVLF